MFCVANARNYWVTLKIKHNNYAFIDFDNAFMGFNFSQHRNNQYTGLEHHDK